MKWIATHKLRSELRNHLQKTIAFPFGMHERAFFREYFAECIIWEATKNIFILYLLCINGLLKNIVTKTLKNAIIVVVSTKEIRTQYLMDDARVPAKKSLVSLPKTTCSKNWPSELAGEEIGCYEIILLNYAIYVSGCAKMP